MSATVQQWVNTEVTSYTSSDLSVPVYDGIPIITKIDFGLYAVPKSHAIEAYI